MSSSWAVGMSVGALFFLLVITPACPFRIADESDGDGLKTMPMANGSKASVSTKVFPEPSQYEHKDWSPHLRENHREASSVEPPLGAQISTSSSLDSSLPSLPLGSSNHHRKGASGHQSTTEGAKDSRKNYQSDPAHHHNDQQEEIVYGQVVPPLSQVVNRAPRSIRSNQVLLPAEEFQPRPWIHNLKRSSMASMAAVVSRPSDELNKRAARPYDVPQIRKLTTNCPKRLFGILL